MATNEEIDVEQTPEAKELAVVVDQAIAKDAPAAEKDGNGSGDLKAAVELLKKQVESEKQGRIDAERRAQQASSEVFRAKNEVEDTNLRLVNNAIETVSEQNRMLKAEYARAMAAQDFNRVADLQEAMSGNSAKLLQLQNGKAAMEERPKQAAPQMSDPVEALASQLSPRSAAWVRSHPEYARDTRKYGAMIGAHNIAISNGVAEDSDAYFQEVERVLGIGQRPSVRDSDDDGEELTSAAKAVSSRSSPPPAAPVSRSGSAPGSAGSSRTYRLTKAEAEMAEASGLTVEEYARNKAALKSEGRILN